MPIYEFTCSDCCHQFEHLVLSKDETTPKCPCCQSEKVNKLISAGCIRPDGIACGGGGFNAPKCGAAAAGG